MPLSTTPIAEESWRAQFLSRLAATLYRRGRLEEAETVVAHLRDRGWNDPDFLELSRGL